MDTAGSPTNVRVVPDLGDELLLAIDRLEVLLGSMAIWEMEDDVGLPAPFAGGKALAALQTVADVVRPTEGRDEPQLVSGRLPRRGWTGRRLRLRFVPIPDARSRRLSTPCNPRRAAGVPRPRRRLEQYTAVIGELPLALVSGLSRTVSLLTLPWDDDVGKLGVSEGAPRQVRPRAQSQRAAGLRPGRAAYRRSLVLPARRRGMRSVS